MGRGRADEGDESERVMPADLKARILGLVDDAVSDLLYYDRKNDEEISSDAIDKAVRDGVISIDEMVQKFRDCLVKGLRDA